MTPEERALLTTMFDRIDATPVGPLDGDADQLIRQRITANPAAPYAMAQTIAVQNQLLEKADARIRALEATAPTAPQPSAAGPVGRPSSAAWNVPAAAAASTGPSGMAAEADAVFRDGDGTARSAGRTSVPASGGRPVAGAGAGGGTGSFLAGAGQVALGVAGGVLLGSAIGSLLSSDPAEAASPEAADELAPEPAEPQNDPGYADEPGFEEPGFEDDGGFFDGFFGE